MTVICEWLLPSIAVALFAALGCAAAAPPADPGAPELVRVQGRLTDEGVECPALRGDDGRLFTLATRDLRGFKVGDRVIVEGTIAEVSYCMQGTTISVKSIVKAP